MQSTEVSLSEDEQRETKFRLALAFAFEVTLEAAGEDLEAEELSSRSLA